MNQIFPQRKSPRLKYFDYTSPNYYFVTICTHEKKCIFGTAECLNEYGHIAEKGLHELTKHFKNMELHKCVVMPNHVHAILIIEENSGNLSTMVGAYKAFVTRKIREINREMIVWQRSFHDHIIRTQKGYEKIWMYIENNPLKWKEDCFYTEDNE